MVIRLQDPTRFKKLAPGKFFHLKSLQPRVVRLEVNCPEPAKFFMIDDRKNLFFLATISGFDVLEFVAPEVCHVVVESAEPVFYYTSDGDTVAFEQVGQVTFTTLATRRSRNPELELMMWKLEQNMTRRVAAQMAELQAMGASGEVVDDETGEVREGTTSGGEGTATGAPAGGSEPSDKGADGDAKSGA